MSYKIEESTRRLMPEGYAWLGSNSGSIKELTDGLSQQIERDKIDGNNIIRDYYPYYTEMITELENEHGLPTPSYLSDNARRAILFLVRKNTAFNTYSGLNKLINLYGFTARVIPLEDPQDPNTITNVLEILQDGRSKTLVQPLVIPTDYNYRRLFFIVENLDGTPIQLDDEKYSILRFIILKHKPPFMWCILRAIMA